MRLLFRVRGSKKVLKSKINFITDIIISRFHIKCNQILKIRFYQFSSTNVLYIWIIRLKLSPIFTLSDPIKQTTLLHNFFLTCPVELELRISHPFRWSVTWAISLSSKISFTNSKIYKFIKCSTCILCFLLTFLRVQNE